MIFHLTSLLKINFFIKDTSYKIVIYWSMNNQE